MSSMARSASQPSRMTVDEPVNNGTAMHDSSPVAWAMGAGMYDRSSHLLPSQHDVRSGEATKLRVLWATPLAPEVVPDVQPTSAGASTSTWSTRKGDAACVSSNDVHPGTDPRSTTRTGGAQPTAAPALATMSAWATPPNSPAG